MPESGSLFPLCRPRPSLPSRDVRNRWETTCIPFLSDVFVARPRVNRSSRPSLPRSLAGCPRFSPFRKSRVAIDRSLRCVLLGAFPSCRRAACVLGQPTVTIYGRIYIRILFTSPRRKDVECMAGHRSAGLSEFGFNALGITR